MGFLEVIEPFPPKPNPDRKPCLFVAFATFCKMHFSVRV